ncbi:MAG: hypothetical protein EB079_00595 [Verrucomicrobia bacterium]|nr:hypothetical protein [Verrucomicrobiota bacterium]
MIKTFEAFKKIEIESSSQITDELFRYCYDKITILNNDTTPIGELDDLLSKINDNFFEGDCLITPFDELDFEPSISDKIDIVDAYEKIEMRYKISELPDLDKLNEVLLDIFEITNIDFVIDLKKKTIEYNINTIPSVKYFPNVDNIKFDINEWDSIVQEIKPAVGRIEDLGYNVEAFFRAHGKISIVISNI